MEQILSQSYHVPQKWLLPQCMLIFELGFHVPHEAKIDHFRLIKLYNGGCY
jgi:hypothetical protein